MTVTSKVFYEDACAELEKIALHDTGKTSRRAADFILSLTAAEKPQLDLSGICGYFDDKNFRLLLTALRGFRLHGQWPSESEYFGPEDLICKLHQLHYQQAA